MDILAAVAVVFVIIGIVVEIVEMRHRVTERRWRGKRKL